MLYSLLLKSKRWLGQVYVTRSESMGRLLERLKKECSQCGDKTFPRRINGRYADGEAERVYLWECRKCAHIWVEHKRGDSWAPSSNTSLGHNVVNAKNSDSNLCRTVYSLYNDS